MQLPWPRKLSQPGFCPEIAVEFGSLEEARNSLDYQWNVCLKKTVDFERINVLKEGNEAQEHQDAYDCERIHQLVLFHKWSAAFQAFLEKNVSTMNSKALRGAMVLKLSARVGVMHLKIASFQLVHEQTCWDQLQSTYEELVDLATAVIDSQRAADREISQKPIFQMDHGIIAPLFVVAHKCRDPYLRRRAITLLYCAPRQEGVWDSILTARVAERVMNLEEEGLGEVRCAADVPDRARISDVQVSFDLQARRGYITFLRLRSLESQIRVPVTDVLEW